MIASGVSDSSAFDKRNASNRRPLTSPRRRASKSTAGMIGSGSDQRWRSRRRKRGFFGAGQRRRLDAHTRSDGIDAHTRAFQLQGETLGERLEPELRGTVGGLRLERHDSGTRGDVDDRSALQPQGRQQTAAEDERRRQVDGQRMRPIANRLLLHAGQPQDRGVIDQQVKTFHPSGYAAHEITAGAGVGQVDASGPHAAAVLLDHRDRGAELLVGLIAERHPRSLGGQGHGHRSAQTTAGAGDHRFRSRQARGQPSARTR